MTSAPGGEADVVEGTVVRVTYENDETGFRVVRVRPVASKPSGTLFPQARTRAQDDDLVTVVGRFPAVAPGENVRAVGKWERDARHGEQLKAEVVTAIAPTTKAGIQRYLSGGAFKGVGKQTAKKIVDHFGTQTIAVLDREPHRLSEVTGLGKTRATALAQAWRAQRVVRELMVVLASLEIPPGLAHRIHKRYGDRALEVVKTAPYRLAMEVWGVGFKSADAIARQVGIAVDDPQRAEAGVLHTLATLAEEGHTVTPRALLAERAARILDPASPTDTRNAQEPPDARFVAGARTAMQALLAARLVVEEPEGIAHTPLAAQEEGLAQRLGALLSSGSEKPLVGIARAIEAFERSTGIALAPAQRAAIELVARAPVAVVTGGPGVGKTTVVRAILALFTGARLRTALAAPTGRAAKRMTEATGHPATTIHRLLEVDPRKGRFTRDETNPLDLDALIVDESSMVDVPLAFSLARAIPAGARLVLVGDVDQLPSVGPGSVLRDAIVSGVVPTARLTEVFRQAGSSRIVVGAHAILRGEEPTPSPPSRMAGTPTGELFVVERNDPEEAARTIVEIVESRIPKAFSLDPKRDVQVLVPMVRGAVGVRSLNAELQARLNPTGDEVRRGSAVFRVGDRVMQMRNDYDREVFNGDVGFVTAVRRDEPDAQGTLVVRLEEGREFTAEDDELDELSLAYACTVHKAQGSEYPAVVIGLVNQHFVMLARKLLYTAVTRARKLVVLVGSRWALRQAVQDARAEERRTTLARRLGA
ncbi:MAG: ATP-dependent RecD-like DNA helicase [Deltaproteobacteria bacterium]|nr:ATP-dependent RecD-like DNA helicase [Deltaproteobacteria bacterium]